MNRLVMAFVIAMARTAAAQTPDGSVSGVATDTAHLPVSGVEIRTVNRDSGW
jgi:hypothetical protein